MNPIILIIGAAALLILIVGVIMSVTGDREVQSRLEQISAPDRVVAKAAEAAKRSSPLGDLLNRTLSGRGFAEGIAADLARADLKFTVGEYLATLAIVTIAAGGIAYFISGGSVIFAVIAAVGGFFVPRIYVGYMQGRRLTMFNNQLGDTINLLVNGLRSGYSVLQAMEAVARELPPPVSSEFDRVVKEVTLGLTLEQALQNMLRRVKSEDLDLVITAINVQREVGGNLAEILDVISFTIRERVRIKGEITVLTAQGMLTGWVITLLPVGLMGVLYVANRDYIARLWTSGLCGYAMLIAGGILITSGFLIIQKIVRIEV